MAFAIYVQGIQQSLPEDKKPTVFDVMTLCEVRDGKKPLSNKQIAHKLEQMGFHSMETTFQKTVA